MPRPRKALETNKKHFTLDEKRSRAASEAAFRVPRTELLDFDSLKDFGLSEAAISEFKRLVGLANWLDDPVAASIREFGFLSPIVVDKAGCILAGHTRFAAAKMLGLETVPVLVAADLDDAKARAYRLADNKTAELAEWDNALLLEELTALENLDDFAVDMADFGFDFDDQFKRRAAWSRTEKFCNLKKKIAQHTNGDLAFCTMFDSNKDGDGFEIKTLKENPDNAPLIADNLVDYLETTFGRNMATADWVMIVPPRRRHKDFHFATAIAKAASDALHIPFYPDSFIAKDKSRIEPSFEMVKTPSQQNVVLFDDICTTGVTVRACRQLLFDAGKTVFVVTAIFNPSKS